MAAYARLTGLSEGLAARTAGDGGETVLWLHDHALDSRVWEPIWDALPDWRHVGVDLPGHGVSLPLGRGTQLPAFARAITDAVAPLGVRHVVGHGLGALIALQIAVDPPGPLRSLVLVQPMVGGGPHDPALLTRYRELLSMFRMAGLGPHLRGRWMSASPGPFDHVDPESALWRRTARVISRHTWPELLDGTLARMLEHSHEADVLAGIAAATLILVAQEARPAVQGAAQRLETQLADCRIHELEGTGHFGLWSSPGDAAAVIHEHLRRSARPVPA